jgi:pimeloyl-ACP methyl ester carboxylesterase
MRRLDHTIDLLPPDEELVTNALAGVNLYRANVWQRLRQPRTWTTSVPVLLVVATQDGFVTPRALTDLERHCSDLTRVEVAEGHWLPRARPTQLARLVTSFVRRHATRVAGQ